MKLKLSKKDIKANRGITLNWPQKNGHNLAEVI